MPGAARAYPPVTVVDDHGYLAAIFAVRYPRSRKARMSTLASIHIYPLKGCRAIDLRESEVEPWGLAGDRRWLVVDSDFRFFSQREHASMARLAVSYDPGGGIRV